MKLTDHPLLLLALLALARKFRERSDEEYAQAVDKLAVKFAEKKKPKFPTAPGRRGRIIRKTNGQEHLPTRAEANDVSGIHTAAAITAAGTGKPATSGEVAGPHADAEKAQALLTAAQSKGARVVSEITRSAIKRLTTGHTGDGVQMILASNRLFNDQEIDQLADIIAQVRATANLLGRSKTVLQYHKATEQADKFSENDPTDLSRFAEGDGRRPLHPMAPERAVEYFRGLVPKLNVEPNRFGPAMRRDAFTMATATDQRILERVQSVLNQALETGKGMEGRMENRRGVVGDIDQILDDAGVSVRNPQYTEQVMRTNTMDAYSIGTMEAMQDPDVARIFPAWQYHGIKDGRQRPQHEAHFGKIYSTRVSFAEVRDSLYGGKFSGYNCRCTPGPISRMSLRRMGQPEVLEHVDLQAAEAFMEEAA